LVRILREVAVSAIFGEALTSTQREGGLALEVHNGRDVP